MVGPLVMHSVRQEGKGMRNEKLLILESSWAEDGQYISDSRSCSRIYRGVEALLSTQDLPILTVVRPLLACRFPTDIDEFVQLPCNQKGVNIVILAGHGRHKWVKIKGEKVHRRLIQAIDQEINVSRAIRPIRANLKRTIFILDSCQIGQGVRGFRQAGGSLGVIGFAETVDWIDSAVFILALLLRFQDGGVFQMERMSPVRPRKVLKEMKAGPYRDLIKHFHVESSFA
jgi:hypothetical protein